MRPRDADDNVEEIVAEELKAALTATAKVYASWFSFHASPSFRAELAGLAVQLWQGGEVRPDPFLTELLRTL